MSAAAHLERRAGAGVASAPPVDAGGRGRHQHTHRVARFELESGAVLHDVRQAYHLDGELNAARDNLVVVMHALTGSADAAGDWWRDVIGPGRAIDTGRHAVLCANLLGSCYGTTGPADPARRPFPRITTRDMARFVAELVASLGVESVALAVGGSLGGMVTLELATTFPALARSAVVIAAPAAHPAAAIGWSHVQRETIDAAGARGLEIARMIAMLTYRTAHELDARFGRDGDGSQFDVQRYLARHGRTLRDRFDVHSYRTLLDAMDGHDVGRGRGGVEPALRRVRGRLVGVGIPGDFLYPEHQVRRWTTAAGAGYREIHSVHGHDAFLLEGAQVSTILRDALA